MNLLPGEKPTYLGVNYLKARRGLRLESRMLALATDYGDVEIREKDLSSITEAELKRLRITRTELNRAFAEGVQLMKSRSDRVRPVAHKTFDGTWRVDLFRYSPTIDLLMERKPAGRGSTARPH